MPATYENESYAGVIEALNEVAYNNGRPIRAYEPNFNGIIAAIQNLNELGDANIGEYPPFWENETDENGNIIGGDFEKLPKNGDLWFDTRQGRLMVWVDDGYYQTNGADSLTVVSPNQPLSEVVGGFWYNPDTRSLYVNDGQVWNDVVSPTFSTVGLPLSIESRNRADITNPQLEIIDQYQPETEYNQSTLNQWVVDSLGQLDKAIVSNAVEAAIPETFAQSTEPADPNLGNIWFNTDTNLLQIYTSSGWRITTDLSDVYSQLSSIEEDHEKSNDEIQNKFDSVETLILALRENIDANTLLIAQGDAAVMDSITGIIDMVGDLDRFQLKADAAVEHAAIEERLSLLENETGPDLNSYASLDRLNAGLASLATTISEFNYAPKSYVESRISEIQIPDISSKLDKSVFDQHLSNANNTYIKRTGGTITGSLVLDYTDIDATTLDFSSSFASGIKAIGLKAKNATAPVTFGTTAEPLEIAWQFSGNEDFKWKYGTKDVLKVNKNGVSTPALFVNGINVESKLAELQARPSGGSTVDLSPLEAKLASLEHNVNTMSIPNISGLEQAVIDLQINLSSLESSVNGISIPDITALEQSVGNHQVKIASLESSVNAISIPDISGIQQDVLDLQTKVNAGLCTNQIYYQDNAPTNVHDGDIWFNSCTLCLYVRHSNAWINPDRVVDETPEPTPAPEVDLSAIHTQLSALQAQFASLSGHDLNLRADLFNAVATSISFLDLKNKLMSALSC